MRALIDWPKQCRAWQCSVRERPGPRPYAAGHGHRDQQFAWLRTVRDPHLDGMVASLVLVDGLVGDRNVERSARPSAFGPAYHPKLALGSAAHLIAEQPGVDQHVCVFDLARQADQTA